MPLALLLVLGAGSVACLGLLARWLAGYPAPPRALRGLDRRSWAFVTAAGDTLFPPGGAVPPSSEDVDVPGYLDAWMAGLPPAQRRLIGLLFLALEQATLIWGRGVGGRLRRFSELPPAAREAYLHRLEQHPLFPVRALLAALRTIFSFAYLDRPAVQEALGIEPPPAHLPTSTHLRPETMGSGRLITLVDHGPEVEESCDVVVVGTGAGGGVAARELARAGLDVVILEEGPFIRPEQVAADTGTAMTQVLAEAGLRTFLAPSAVATIQGRCVGGSTFPNSAILFRIPDDILDEWRDEHGIEGLTNAALAESYARVERLARKAPASAAELGRKNELFAEGAAALGIEAHAFDLGKHGCRGSASCLPACRIGAKYSTDLSHIPDAVQAGARLYTQARCDRVQARGGQAQGLTADFVDASGRVQGRMKVKARAVVLAGGVLGTPLILERSGLANRSGMVGKNLHGHPGAAIYAVFDERVEPWKGHTQGFGAFLDEHRKIEVLWSPLSIMAVRMPGFGHALKENLALFPHIAVWDVVVRGTSTGRILFGSGSDPVVWFPQNQVDVDRVASGLGLLGEMAFAVGAKAVMPGAFGLPDRFTDPAQLAALGPGMIKANQLVMASTHLFGTCRMGADPRRSVVDSHGECHDVRGLYIVDGSVLPNGTRVNPHEPIMAVADYFAHGIAAKLGGAARP
ncbi:MAG: FAD-dependent oxidoreductase [Pseudomonadota bacterium]